MVVTYDGVDPPLCFSLSLSLLSQTFRLNHTRNIYDTAYHVSIYLIVGVVARIPLYIQKKNHVYVTCHIRHFFNRRIILVLMGKNFDNHLQVLGNGFFINY